MNAEILAVQKLFLQLYVAQREFLKDKPRQLLEDLQHEADTLRNHTTLSIRVSAEINYVACLEALGRLS